MNIKLKRSILLITLSVNAIFLQLFAQRISVNKSWEINSPYQLGFYNTDTKFDSEGNSYFAGSKFNGHDYDMFLRKVQSDGTQLFLYEFDYDSLNDVILDFTLDNNANIFFTGLITTGTDSTEIIVGKLDAGGQLTWSKTLNHSNNSSYNVGVSLSINESGDRVFVSGSSYDTSSGYNITIISLNGTGVIQWDSTYDINNMNDLAEHCEYIPAEYDSTMTLIKDEYLEVRAVSIDSFTHNQSILVIEVDPILGHIDTNYTSSISSIQGIIEIAGILKDTLQGNTFVYGKLVNQTTGESNIYVSMYDSDLTFQWETIKTGTASNSIDYLNSAVIDTSGNFIGLGTIENSNSSYDLYLTKIDNQGSTVWERTFDGGELDQAFGYHVTLCEGKDPVIAGRISNISSNKLVTVKYSGDGELKWFRAKPTQSPVTVNGIWYSTEIQSIILEYQQNDSSNSCSTICYTESLRDIAIDTSDSTSRFVKSELIVKINPKYVDTSFVNNQENEFAYLSEIVPDSIYDSITSCFSFYDFNPKMVKIFPSMTTDDTISISRLGDTVRIPEFWSSFIMYFYENDSLEVIERNLDSLGPIVVYSHKNYLGEPHSAPNDDEYPSQASLGHGANGLSGIKAETAWNTETGYPGIKVGVMEWLWDWQHPDLDEDGNSSNQNWITKDGYDFSASSRVSMYDIPLAGSQYNLEHGTKVAGIIGAARNNDLGVAGIAGGDYANNSKGVSLYMLSVGGYLFPDVLDEGPTARALFHASSSTGLGLNIINCSYGNYADLPELIEEQVIFAWRNGVTIVCSRGNSNDELDDPKTYFSGFEDKLLVTVGASGEQGKRFRIPSPTSPGKYFQSMVKYVDIVAPGEASNVYTTQSLPNRGYTNFQATSAAAPHVSGVVALLQSNQNSARRSVSGDDVDNLAPEDAEWLLENFARPITTDYDINGNPVSGLSNVNDRTGHGLVNADSIFQNFSFPTDRIYHFDIDYNTMTTSTSSTPFGVAFLRNTGDYQVGEIYSAYLVEKTFTYNLSFPTGSEIKGIWIRSSGIEGCNNSTGINYLPDGELYFGTLGSNTLTVTGITYTWKLPAQNVAGISTPQTYYPAEESDMKFAFSVLLRNSALGISNIEENKRQVVGFPNPSNGTFNISILNNSSITIRNVELFSIDGKRIFEDIQVLELKSTYSLDCNTLPAGMYLVRITDSNNESYTLKMIRK